MGTNASEAYRRQSVETSPGRLVLMLYDGGISALNRSATAIENSDVEETNRQLIKAQDIIRELMLGLDTSYEIGQQLELLYDYMVNRLIEANLKKDLGIITEVKDFLIELRDVWNEMLRGVSEASADNAATKTLNVSG